MSGRTPPRRWTVTLQALPPLEAGPNTRSFPRSRMVATYSLARNGLYSALWFVMMTLSALDALTNLIDRLQYLRHEFNLDC